MPEISQQSHVLRPADLPGIDRGRGARTTPLVTVGRGATAFITLASCHARVRYGSLLVR